MLPEHWKSLVCNKTYILVQTEVRDDVNRLATLVVANNGVFLAATDPYSEFIRGITLTELYGDNPSRDDDGFYDVGCISSLSTEAANSAIADLMAGYYAGFDLLFTFDDPTDGMKFMLSV